MKLQALPLSQEASSTYGDVIETQQRGLFHINDDLVERYHDLALVEILEQDHTLISINRAQPTDPPLTAHGLERHPPGTQVLILMKGEVFVVVVTLGDDEPDLSALRMLITNGEQGMNYHRNVWHHPPFIWQRATGLLTTDRGGNDNCDVESIPGQEFYST